MDPISEMLTRIRNAQRAGHKDVVLPFSKIKMAIVEILEKEGFVDMVKKESDGKFDVIRVALKYEQISNTEKAPAITGIDRVSHLGQRIYVKKDAIEKVKNNYGISIVSTSKGVMTGSNARKLSLGGEYICKVW